MAATPKPIRKEIKKIEKTSRFLGSKKTKVGRAFKANPIKKEHAKMTAKSILRRKKERHAGNTEPKELGFGGL